MKDPYIIKIFENFENRNKNQPEFVQAVREILNSIEILASDKMLKESSVIERIIEPERAISFRVSYVNDKGEVKTNRGYRVQFNSAVGPFKGGLRFHENVNFSIMNFLAFEQVFKNSLTGLNIGGAKGGSDFSPKNKSDNEIMRFCQSFMTELYRHIGQFTDIPAGDIGVGEREIGFLYGQYKKIRNEFVGTLTGKGLTYGGSHIRKEATGYGLTYFGKKMLNDNSKDFKGAKIIVSGSGNVAIYAAEKIVSFGGKVVAMSDSDGYIYSEDGLDIETIKKIKETDRKRIRQYLDYYSKTFYSNMSSDIFSIPCDIVVPAATQNEIDENSAKILVENGCYLVLEGANMPTTENATKIFLKNNVLLAPAKAANSGGVSVSYLEMSQNSMRESFDRETVENKLENIMNNIYFKIKKTSEKYDLKNNYVSAANIAGFLRVSSAMLSQGV